MNDPEPYLQVYSHPTYAPFSRRATGGSGATYSPRHGFDDHECDHHGCPQSYAAAPVTPDLETGVEG